MDQTQNKNIRSVNQGKGHMVTQADFRGTHRISGERYEDALAIAGTAEDDEDEVGAGARMRESSGGWAQMKEGDEAVTVTHVGRPEERILRRTATRGVAPAMEKMNAGSGARGISGEGV